MSSPACHNPLLQDEAPAPCWDPLSLRRMLRHFPALAAERQTERALEECASLLPEEKVVLRFVLSVYSGSKATVQLYTRYVSGLMNHARLPAVAVRAEHVDNYLRSFEQAGAKPATCAVIAASLKSFFRHLQDMGHITRNPMATVRKRRTPGRTVLSGHLTHSLDETDMALLLQGLDKVHAPRRDKALLVLLFMTGLRAEEVVRLTRRQLVLWQGEYFLDVNGKGQKQRRVYVPTPALQALRAYDQGVPGSPGPDMPLLGHLRDARKSLTRHGVYALVKKWCTRLLNNGAVSPHWFRHTCFTQLALKGVPLEAIKAMAGHESVETTMRYNEAAALMDAPGKVFE